MSGELIPFPSRGRTARAIVIRPDGDGCRAVLAGAPLHEGEQFDIPTGELWQVVMLAKDHRRGLPILVSDKCRGRPGHG